MQVNEDFVQGMGLDPVEGDRRAQIIEATIRTVAELGYAQTSFAKIIERAGLSSTRLISYHFDNKAELMMATVGVIVDRADSFLAERIGDEARRIPLLRGYIESEVAFLGAHPEHGKALVEIGQNARTEDGNPIFGLVWQDLRFGRLERQLRQGQQTGDLGDFDPQVMAMAIRHAIDGVAVRQATDPDLDLNAYGKQLADLFERAVAPT